MLTHIFKTSAIVRGARLLDWGLTEEPPVQNRGGPRATAWLEARLRWLAGAGNTHCREDTGEPAPHCDHVECFEYPQKKRRLQKLKGAAKRLTVAYSLGLASPARVS